MIEQDKQDNNCRHCKWCESKSYKGFGYSNEKAYGTCLLGVKMFSVHIDAEGCSKERQQEAIAKLEKLIKIHKK